MSTNDDGRGDREAAGALPTGRPAPQYGEYATPEQQRAAIRQPDATEALEVGEKPTASAPRPFTPAPGAVSPGRAVDRFATIAMLAYGAFSTVTAIIGYLDLPGYLANAYRVLGVTGQFTNVDSARLWGPVAAVAIALGFVVTALVAVRRLRRARISFWVPLVGFAVTMALVTAMLSIPLFGDPAFQQFVSGS